MAGRVSRLLRTLRLWASLLPILIGSAALGLAMWVALIGPPEHSPLARFSAPLLAILLAVLGLGILVPVGRVRQRRIRLLRVAVGPLPRPTVVGWITITVAGLLMAQAPGEVAPATQNLLYMMASALIGLVVTNLVLGGRQLRPISVTRNMPSVATCGEPVVLTVNLRNLGRVPAGVVQVREAARPGVGMRQHETAVLWVAARSSASASTQAVFLRRGLHRLGRIRISSAFPFGLVRHIRTMWASGEILVLPRRIEPPASLLQEIVHHRQMVGSSSRVRGADDVVALREYQAGDPVARIHWPTSARAGHPMLLEFDAPSHPPVMLVLDPWRCEGGSGGNQPTGKSQFETLVSLAAGLAHRLLHQEHAVGLHVPGAMVVRPGMGQGKWSEVMHSLARCGRQSGDPADWLAWLLSPVPDGAVAVLVTAREPDQVPRLPGVVTLCLGDASVQSAVKLIRSKTEKPRKKKSKQAPS